MSIQYNKKIDESLNYVEKNINIEEEGGKN